MSEVEIPWPDGQTKSVPALWLRDNCPCEACRVQTTGEHRHLISTTSIDLAPVSTSVDHSDGDLAIVVDWGDHVSRYSTEWVAATVDQIARSHHDRAPWTPDFSPPRTALADLENPSVERAFLTDFATLGAVIITDTPTAPGSLVDIIRRWAPPLEVPFDLVHDVLVDPTGYNVAHTAEALPPHNDMASRKHPPSGQVLHMLVNDAEGGDSIIVDGLGVLAELDPDDLAVLADLPVAFRQFSETVETWAREPIVRLDASDTVIALRYANQLLQAVDPTDPRTGRWYEAYHHLSAALTNPERQCHFRLGAGDLLMLDAHRVLHGRTQFSPGTGARHLQDVYFDADDVRNELARLERAAVNELRTTS